MSETSSRSSLSDLEADLPVGSYGAMLRSYARRSGTSKSSISGGHTPTRSATVSGRSSASMSDGQRRRASSDVSSKAESSRTEDLGELSLAMLLDYEVS